MTLTLSIGFKFLLNLGMGLKYVLKSTLLEITGCREHSVYFCFRLLGLEMRRRRNSAADQLGR